MCEEMDNAATAHAAAASAASEAAVAKLHAVDQQLQEAKAASTSSEAALEEIDQQLKQTAARADRLQKQLQDAEAEAAAAADAAAAAAQHSKAVHDALEDKLKASDAQLISSREQSSAAASAAALTIKELQASCESLKQSTAALQQDLNSMREGLSAAESAAAVASSRCDSLQSELSSTQALLADARVRVEAEEARAQELEGKAAEVEGLRNELEEARAQIVVVQKKSADSIRQLQREVARQKSQTDGGGGMAGGVSAGAELSPVHPASIKIAELEGQVALLKEELERKKRMLSEIAEGGAGSGVIMRGAQATSSGGSSPAPPHKDEVSDKGVGSKLMSGFKKGGMAALTLGGLIPHKSSPKPDAASHAIDQEKMNAMEAMLEETVMSNNKLQRQVIKVQHRHVPPSILKVGLSLTHTLTLPTDGR